MCLLQHAELFHVFFFDGNLQGSAVLKRYAYAFRLSIRLRYAVATTVLTMDAERSSR